MVVLGTGVPGSQMSRVQLWASNARPDLGARGPASNDCRFEMAVPGAGIRKTRRPVFPVRKRSVRRETLSCSLTEVLEVSSATGAVPCAGLDAGKPTLATMAERAGVTGAWVENQVKTKSTAVQIARDTSPAIMLFLLLYIIPTVAE